MNTNTYLTSLISYLTLIPSAMLCFAPVNGRLKLKKQHVLTAVICLFVLILPLLSYIETSLSLAYNTLMLPLMVVCFIAYNAVLDTHISRSLSVFVLVSALMAFMSNFSIAFDAFLHPSSDLDHFSLAAACFQLFISILLAALLYYPFARYGAYLIDNLSNHFIWFITAMISGIFLGYNLNNIVRYYSTLHTNHVARAYYINMALFFLLLLALNVIFYFLVNSLLEKAKTEERNRILEMQEKRYLAQQQYLKDTARARHDFRHILRTLQELLAKDGKNAEGPDAGAHSALAFLNQYIEKLPAKDGIDYCADPAVNAVLNHYLQMADSAGIHTEIRINLPEELRIDSIDLCSILGNLLENAITACQDVAADGRLTSKAADGGLISLTISPEQGSELYIAVSNSFNGRPDLKGGHYHSTKKDGGGIGLLSVKTTAEHYGGNASFYHEGTMFYSNVMLKNQSA